jgi:hypothetical protein
MIENNQEGFIKTVKEELMMKDRLGTQRNK